MLRIFMIRISGGFGANAGEVPVARLLLWAAHNPFFAIAKEGKPSAPVQWLPTAQKNRLFLQAD
ncbi:hypothetical protein [Rhizobium sp. PDO1-076]|uniref:hypothetical protein n=1 Tax=Rhizobium sp. PDO1-076 TaxID=1125979 RepID=UPI0011467805|nr:hypothetical protein [Rhizobium sp. PDO1-076]